MRRLHEYSSPEELYDNLVNMLHLLYFRHVLVNPKERKVVVVESLLTPTLFRETLAKVLYTHYEVSGAVWADSGRLCALPLAAPVALVLQVGAAEAEVTPVVHGCVVLRAVQSAPLAARALHEQLQRRLDEDNGAQLDLPDHVIEDIKVKTCFVTKRERAVQWQCDKPPAPCRDVQYPDAGRGTIRVTGRTRELTAEVLFARDGEMSSLGDIVLQCIMQCPRDCRRALAGNILVTGGTAAMPGLVARLAAELRALVTEEPYLSKVHVKEFLFHRGVGPAGSGAWAGGAALGGAAGGGGRALARERYVRAPRLPDWACLLDNTPKDHPHWRLDM